LLLLAALLAAACYAPATPAPAPPPPDTPAAPQAGAGDELATLPAAANLIPLEALRNATYSGIYEQPITLADGVYQAKPAAGDLARPQVQVVDSATLSGDLDGDGVDDAVVFLVERGGGSGVFTYVAAQLNRAGRPVDAGAVRIEDRIGVKSAAVEDGQVALDIITQGPGDVACCGAHNAHKTYALQDGRLVEITPQGGELVKVSAADLNGMSWTLLAIDGEQPAPAESEVTLSFQGSQVSGSGGCNSYSGSFSLDEANPFVMAIGPLAATERACPDPAGAQEAAYFAALDKVSQWAYVFGQLALGYQDDSGELGRRLFAPQAAPVGEGQ
jgi:heat shock protein HslJ